MSFSVEEISSGQLGIRVVRRSKRSRKSSVEVHPTVQLPKKKRKALKPLPHAVLSRSDLVRLVRVTKGETQEYQDLERLPTLYQIIERIDRLVDMHDAKERLTDIIMTWLQPSLEKRRIKAKNKENSMEHICIMGPSGCGKTTLAQILTDLYQVMGLIKTNRIVKGNRSNMIANHCGGTAKETRKLVMSALGGCLLIDEAYQLNDGNEMNSQDSFSKECMDTLTQLLSEYGNKFLCIIIGYEKDLNRDFFASNEGLPRRFPETMRFKVTAYSPAGIRQIFLRKLQDQNLDIAAEAGTVQWFTTVKDLFPHGGGSVSNFITGLWRLHSRRVFGKPEWAKGTIIQADLEATAASIQQHAPKVDRPPAHMYT